MVLIHFHGLSSFLLSSGTEDSEQTNSLQRKAEKKSIEFLDIIDKSLDRKVWKQVQKELKRKRSFSEGEITKSYQTKNVSHNPKRLLRPIVAKPICDTTGQLNKYNEKANNIRIQVRNVWKRLKAMTYFLIGLLLGWPRLLCPIYFLHGHCDALWW